MRVKTGFTRHRAHKKLLKRTKGYRMSKHKLIKSAREASLHAGQYAFNSRRKKKGAFRELWIQRIHASLIKHELSYSTFIHLLAKSQVSINRKMLAELAFSEPEAFDSIIQEVKAQA